MQLKEALDRVEKEHHAILFLSSLTNIDMKIMEDMENEVLQKKVTFSKQCLTRAMSWQAG